MSRTLILTVVLIAICATFFNTYIQGSLEVIPERSAITYENEKYVNNSKTYIRRQSRRGAYMGYLRVNLLQTFGNNLSFHLIFCEYLHNEFRRSFVEMKFKFCDMIHKDPYVGKIFADAGVPCPVPPGLHEWSNISFNIPNVQQLPYKWPYERAKVLVRLFRHQDNETVGDGYVILSFNQRDRLPKSSKSPSKKSVF